MQVSRFAVWILKTAAMAAIESFGTVPQPWKWNGPARHRAGTGNGSAPIPQSVP